MSDEPNLLERMYERAESAEARLADAITEIARCNQMIREIRAKVVELQKQLGECSGGYQTLEREVATLRVNAQVVCQRFFDGDDMQTAIDELESVLDAALGEAKSKEGS